MSGLYTLENPVFVNFSFYAALIGLKMLLMSFLTSVHRYRKKVSSKFLSVIYFAYLIRYLFFFKAFINPEDARLAQTEQLKTDEDVERVRR